MLTSPNQSQCMSFQAESSYRLSQQSIAILNTDDAVRLPNLHNTYNYSYNDKDKDKDNDDDRHHDQDHDQEHHNDNLYTTTAESATASTTILSGSLTGLDILKTAPQGGITTLNSDD